MTQQAPCDVSSTIQPGQGQRLDDPDRLAALYRFAVLDTPAEEVFDRLTRLASRVLKAPVALISLLDHRRQFFKSSHGLGEPWASLQATPLSHSFCQYVVTSGRPLVVEDARQDPLLRIRFAIEDIGVVAYAGTPLITDEGLYLGSFCAIDSEPRTWTDEDLEVLNEFSALAMKELDLRLQEARERAIYSSISDIVLLVGSDLNIQFVNQAVTSVLRRSIDDFVGHPATVVVHPDDRSNMTELFAIAMTARMSDASLEVRFQHGNGDWRWFDLSCTNRIHEPSIAALVVTARDITERKEAEQGVLTALEQQLMANSELEHSNRAQRDFISVVSHEFRTPLTSIQGFSEVIRDEELEAEEIQDFANEIYRSAERLGRLINDMLDLDRMQFGNVTFLQKSVQLNGVVQEVVRSLERVSADHILVMNLDPTMPEFMADRDRLIQVVTNLVRNAINYSPGGGQVIVSTIRENGYAHLTVQDEGLGIPEEALETIFDRFTRVRTKEHKSVKGTGLGLPITRQIVDLHGGDVWVESTLGVGSTFHVRLPIASSA
jgi:PAS domain S-box-containing protein